MCRHFLRVRQLIHYNIVICETKLKDCMKLKKHCKDFPIKHQVSDHARSSFESEGTSQPEKKAKINGLKLK